MREKGFERKNWGKIKLGKRLVLRKQQSPESQVQPRTYHPLRHAPCLVNH